MKWSVKETRGGRGRVRCGRTVAHNHGCFFFDSLLGDGWAQVIGEENGLVLRGGLQTQMLLAGRVEVSEEQADVVPGPVGELFRVPGVGVSARHVWTAGGAADGARSEARPVVCTVISELALPPW